MAPLVTSRRRRAAVLKYVKPHSAVIYREVDMTVYMVERDLKGITMEQLAAAQRRAIDTSTDFSTRGKPVRYIRSTFVPGEERSMCLFEASNPDLPDGLSRN
jgi:Nickel responsive protein SCO4226-like